MPRRNNVQVYRAEVKTAALSHEFGQGLALRWFGRDAASLAAEFGTYTRGPRKGLVRGRIVWVKVTEGGWCYAYQCVFRPGQLFAACLTDEAAGTMANKPTAELISLLPSVRAQA